MKRRRQTTWTAALVAACALGAAFAAVASQQGFQGEPQDTTAQATSASAPHGVPRPATLAATFEGKPIATELPPEVKRLIDGVRHLHEQPGLILDREAVYQSLGVKPTSLHVPKTTGGRYMSEELSFVRPDDDANWQGSLTYSEFPEIGSWSVRVELNYSSGPNCYPSRLVEAYWGKPFVYQPLGVHALLGKFQRKQAGLLPIGPHDGVPYNAGFFSATADTANVSYLIGRGGCLLTVKASNLFKLKEFDDDHIYHE